MYICINPIRLFALRTFSTESNFQTPFWDLSAGQSLALENLPR